VRAHDERRADGGPLGAVTFDSDHEPRFTLHHETRLSPIPTPGTQPAFNERPPFAFGPNAERCAGVEGHPTSART
jgi:hypothetical protein